MVSFPPVSPPRPYTPPISSPIRATCPTHLILLDYITRTILGEEYKSFSSSLCNLLHSPVTSSLLGPNILLNTMFCSQTPSASFSFPDVVMLLLLQATLHFLVINLHVRFKPFHTVPVAVLSLSALHSYTQCCFLS